jgi:arylsulfatase A-like enzyme
MTMKRFAVSLVLTALALAVAGAAERPNIVIILSDDVGHGDLSCYGAKLIRTPNLDRLAAQGRRFTHAYAPGSVCTPTRYALVTGRFCWRTHLQKGVAGSTEPLMIETNRMTIGSLAKAHGYRTAAIGKWHLGYGAPPRTDWNAPLVPGPLEIGFDVHFAVPNNHNDSLRCYVEGREVAGRKPGVPFQMVKGQPIPEGLAQPRVDDLVEATLAGRAVRFIDENHASPFLLYFTPVVAHTHITPAAKYRGTSKAGLYGDYLQQLDAEVGDLLAALDRHGIADRTLVLFSSDNGGALGDFRNAGENLNLADESGDVRAKSGTAKRDARAMGHLTNGSLREGKGSPYEGGHRVPFLVRWPGRVPTGTRCDETVCLADVLATMARILGTELPAGAGEDSFDMLPALCGEPLKTPIHPALVLHSGGGIHSVRSGPWKYVETPDGRKAKPDELYDLAADPGETNNVAAANPDVVKRLAAALDKARKDGRTRP